MFQQVLNTLIEEKWKSSQQADTECTQYRKFISEAKKYHHNKFASYCFGQERLAKFLSELFDNQKEYEELWLTLRILTLFHGQAAVERGSSVNKEVLAPNLQEMNFRGKKEKLWRRTFDQQRRRKKSWKVLLRSQLTQLLRKAKEAEKQKDASQMKALLMGSNVSREKSESCRKGTC